MVDAPDSKSGTERCVGSSPTWGAIWIAEGASPDIPFGGVLRSAQRHTGGLTQMNQPFDPRPEKPACYPFADHRMFVRNAWYVVALADEVTEAILGRTLLSEPLILYRNGAGRVVCLEGACRHRQFPLAHGWKEGDQVRCPYHGFRFGPDGACTQIPSQRRIPPNCALKSYPVVEQWRWIWVWMGDAAKADPSLIPGPEVTWLCEDRNAFPGYELPISARYQLLVENLLDLTHIPFLHNRGQPSGWALGTDWPQEELEADPDGRRLRGTRRFELAQPDIPDCGLSGPVELTVELNFFPPVFFAARLSYRALTPEGGSARPEVRNIHAFTPVSEHETVYYFASARNFADGDPDVTDHFRTRYRKVLDEDKVAAELIEPMVDRPGRPRDFVAEGDRSAIRARRVVQRMIDAER